ncbi:ABC transporter permease [Subtercola boreus]|uniref:ABC transporter permease n=1 Tax=Subtercola boreus TaxID=120213 RepID=UPI00209BE0CA|nr:ABC transporter permease [Subtercola boreus]
MRSLGRPRPRPAEVVSAVILILLVAAALAPQLFTATDPLAIAPASAFTPPSPGHWFGTDESGRDIFTRVIYGARTSLLIGLCATAIGMLLALLLGSLAGLGPRPVDFGVNRLLEVLFAFPGLLLALVFITIFGVGVTSATVAVGLATAPGYARIIRSEIRSIRLSGHIEAAVVLGRSPAQIFRRNILPNVAAGLFALATLGVGQAIVWASALSFLGLGAVPPAAEWGAMLSAGRTYISLAWWLTFFPGAFVVLSAAAATVLGRSLQRRNRER